MANRPNYPKMMEQVLLSLGESRPRLLLHACCAPCSSAVLEMLCGFFDITILYYNPNIWPASEYRRRADELHQFVKQAKLPGITLVEEGYDQSEFYTAVAGLEAEPERGGRCTVCYRLRMEHAARYAAEHGFDWFCSTLSISPARTQRRSTPSAGSWKQNTACATCPTSSSAKRATSAVWSFRPSTACTGRTGAAANSRPGAAPRSRSSPPRKNNFYPFRPALPKQRGAFLCQPPPRREKPGFFRVLTLEKPAFFRRLTLGRPGPACVTI